MVKVVALAKLGAFEKALKISKKIKSKNIYNAAYYNVVGIVCRRLGLLDEALLNSKRAIQIDESLVAAKMNIANIEILQILQYTYSCKLSKKINIKSQ